MNSVGGGCWFWIYCVDVCVPKESVCVCCILACVLLGILLFSPDPGVLSPICSRWWHLFTLFTSQLRSVPSDIVSAVLGLAVAVNNSVL